MELEPAIAQFFDDILRPIVKDAVEEVIKKIPVVPADDLITIQDACRVLKCTRPTLYYHISQGNIKLEKNGRRSLIHKGKLLEDLASGKLALRKDKHRKNSKS